MQDPASAMAVLARHFGMPLDAAALAQIVDGPAFTRHSKFDDAFTATERAAEHQAAEQIHADEIDKVVHWAEAVAKAAGIAMTPPASLLGRAAA